jgi:hypothetical protein
MVAIIMDGSGTGVYKMTRGQKGKTVDFVGMTYAQKYNEYNEGLFRRYYQLVLHSKNCQELTEFCDKDDFSFRRLFGNVTSHKHIIENMFKSLFHDPLSLHPSIGLSNILNDGRDPSVVLAFVSARNKELLKLEKIIAKAVPSHLVIAFCGNTATNAKCEELTEAAIITAKNAGKIGVIILCNNMAQRSFSVPQIDIVLLLTDGGTSIANTQKAARSLTEGLLFDRLTLKTEAVTAVVSVNNPNYEPFLSILIEEAASLDSSSNDVLTNMKYVLQSCNIFAEVGTTCSYRALKEEQIIHELVDSKLLDAINENCFDEETLFDNSEKSLRIQQILINMGKNSNTGNAKQKSKKTQTFYKEDTGNASTLVETSSDNFNKKERDVIVENLKFLRNTVRSVVSLSMGEITYSEALYAILDEPSARKEFETSYHLTIEQALDLCDAGYLDDNVTKLVMTDEKHKIDEERLKMIG